jgi:uncharacterized protein with ParB-like and HNH nuclease domain
MKAGKYSIKELFVNRYVQQIIIPEIQRDYVWGAEQVKGLLESIKKDYDKYKLADIPKVIPADKELEDAFELFYKKRNNGSNIGFIYAYNDDQYSGKYFLIDGQQRITTIYLMLLVLASKNISLRDKFQKTYLTDTSLKLDYKVRESAHNFLTQFVKQTLDNDTDFKNKNWYYSNKYDSDTTINSLLVNFDVIQEYYSDNLSEELESFYNYLEDYVEFWYFDTNISEQGEELYIYMNARGEQMQANENIKADLLSEFELPEEKNKYGKLWEDWQDFFWRNKGKNENADEGFNSFLNWCQLLKSIENRYENNIDLTTDEIEDFADFIRGKETLNFKLIKLRILDIELYFKSIVYYFNNYKQSTSLISVYNNLIEEKWLTGDLSQIDNFRLLPFIYFIKKHKLYDDNEFNSTELIKLNRLFYNLRLDETIGKTAAIQTIYGVKFINELQANFKFDDLLKFENDYKSIFNGEEVLKLKEIISITDLEVKENVRIVFGKAEDHKLLRGKIAHIINVSLDIDKTAFNFDVFSKVLRKYSELLNNEGATKSQLIFSNSFVYSGNRIKLYNDWFKREDFLNVLKDFYLFEGTYAAFFKQKQTTFLSQYESVSILKQEENPKAQLYIYYLLSDSLNIKWAWSNGRNIGVYYGGKDLNSVFDRELYFQHYNKQWHDNNSRIVKIQKEKINESSLVELLKENHA